MLVQEERYVGKFNVLRRICLKTTHGKKYKKKSEITWKSDQIENSSLARIEYFINMVILSTTFAWKKISQSIISSKTSNYRTRGIKSTVSKISMFDYLSIKNSSWNFENIENQSKTGYILKVYSSHKHTLSPLKVGKIWE